MNLRRALPRLGISLGLFIVFALHGAGLVSLRLLEEAERFSYDARLRLSLPHTVDPRIVILDVDERSIAELGQFPWPRSLLAQLVESAFDDYGVAVLGFDVAFAEPDRTALAPLLAPLLAQLEDPATAQVVSERAARLDPDARFAAALRGRPVVLGYYFSPDADRRGTASVGALCAPVLSRAEAEPLALTVPVAQAYTGNLPALQAAAAGCGFFDNATLDADGVYRRVPLFQSYEGAYYASLALAVTRLALGSPPVEVVFDPPQARGSLHLEAVRLGDRRIPVDERAAVLVPYRGRQGSFPYVSAADVIAGRAERAVLEGRIALVGTSAPGLFDLRVTPVAEAFAGVEVHANLISGMLDGRIWQRAPYYRGIELTLLAMVALALALGFTRLSPLASGAVRHAAGDSVAVHAGHGAAATALWLLRGIPRQA
jgi:adenylate cyclase